MYSDSHLWVHYEGPSGRTTDELLDELVYAGIVTLDKHKNYNFRLDERSVFVMPRKSQAIDFLERRNLVLPPSVGIRSWLQTIENITSVKIPCEANIQELLHNWRAYGADDAFKHMSLMWKIFARNCTNIPSSRPEVFDFVYNCADAIKAANACMSPKRPVDVITFSPTRSPSRRRRRPKPCMSLDDMMDMIGDDPQNDPNEDTLTMEDLEILPAPTPPESLPSVDISRAQSLCDDQLEQSLE